MNNSCCPAEKLRFESSDQHEQLWSTLATSKTLKVIDRFESQEREPRFWLFGIFGIGTKIEEQIGFDVYECTNCGQMWKYNEPDNAWRGFFLKMKTNEFMDSFGRKHKLKTHNKTRNEMDGSVEPPIR